MVVSKSGHHVPSVRKSKGRLFAVCRPDKTRPARLPRGGNPGHEYWPLHQAERGPVGPRQGNFPGTDDQPFAAYREV